MKVVLRMSKMTMPLIGIVSAVAATATTPAAAADKKPNIVMLMTDDTGWNDFGAYSGGGVALGHPTPSVDQLAREGAVFTSWYGQASCTAGRASFITGRIPIRSALSIVVAPGDLNYLRAETPTIAEFFQKNGYKGVVVFSRRGGGDWEMLGIDLASPYLDERPLLVPTTPEIREYRLQGFEDDGPTGEMTPPVSVTIGPK